VLSEPILHRWAWMGQHDPTRCDVWWVAAHVDDRRFTIAATVPIRPRCDTMLLTLVELEGRHDRHVGAEMGHGFEFVRSPL
jgi:hypothetical protein